MGVMGVRLWFARFSTALAIVALGAVLVFGMVAAVRGEWLIASIDGAWVIAGTWLLARSPIVRADLVSWGYWLRPFDMLADRRRWRWQRRTPCGRQTFTALPDQAQTELKQIVGSMIAPCRHCGTPKPINTWCASERCAKRVARAQRELAELIEQHRLRP